MQGGASGEKEVRVGGEGSENLCGEKEVRTGLLYSVWELE